MHDAGFKISYIDINMDPNLSGAFEVTKDPQFFVVEDGISYGFEHKIKIHEYNTTIGWFLNGTYKDSLY